MDLKFLGAGSCFNTTLGNTSACLPVGNSAFLLDCGESVFHQIQVGDLLNGFKNINIFVSHSHSDHCGSLSSLLFYCFYVLKVHPKVYAPKAVFQILDLQGTLDEIYEKNVLEACKKKVFQTDMLSPSGLVNISVFPIKESHAEKLESFGFLFADSLGDCFYYSGDSKGFNTNILSLFRLNQVKKIYHDCSWLDYPDNIHLSYKKLCQIITDPEERKRVVLMHFDKGFNFEQAKHDGWSFPTA
ncbi:MAG: MBL fold metallo-hydrolase [Paludibacteraceae bacterium]|nr:MBL fold metallo-hydrolase [Paludibacteraceae bacterium]MCK9615966.1 MBL fold metallo-hydrolase [Candidatus Omnitrophota bacterium]